MLSIRIAAGDAPKPSSIDGDRVDFIGLSPACSVLGAKGVSGITDPSGSEPAPAAMIGMELAELGSMLEVK